MQSALDRFRHIADFYFFVWRMADSSRRSQKNHRGRNFFGQDHRIVPGAAHDRKRFASRSFNCFSSLTDEEWIHGRGLLIELRAPTDDHPTALRDLLRLAEQSFHRASSDVIQLVTRVEAQSSFSGDHVSRSGFYLNPAYGCYKPRRVLGLAFYCGDPLRSGGDCIVTQIHRGRPSVVRAADECDFEPALAGDGLDHTERAAELLEDRSLFDMKFQITEYVFAHLSAGNFCRLQTEFFNRSTHANTIRVLTFQEFLIEPANECTATNIRCAKANALFLGKAEYVNFERQLSPA